MFADCDWAASEKELRRAGELNPGYWMVCYWFAMVLTAQGRYAEAGHQIQLGRQLEPLSPLLAFVSALLNFAARRYSQTEEDCRKGIEIDPGHPLLRMWLGSACEAQSRFAEALRELETAIQFMQGSTMAHGLLVHALVSAGEIAKAETLMQQLLGMAEKQPAETFSLVLAHLAMGQQEKALACLENGCDTYLGVLPLVLKSDPRLDGIRTHPRFLKVLQRMRLAD
jgi:tetratricopeptide (TPR) repeat protein